MEEMLWKQIVDFILNNNLCDNEWKVAVMISFWDGETNDAPSYTKQSHERRKRTSKVDRYPIFINAKFVQPGTVFVIRKWKLTFTFILPGTALKVRQSSPTLSKMLVEKWLHICRFNYDVEGPLDTITFVISHGVT